MRHGTSDNRNKALKNHVGRLRVRLHFPPPLRLSFFHSSVSGALIYAPLMYSVVFFGMVQRGLLITLLFRLVQNHSSECKSSPLTPQTLPLQQNLPSASLCLLLFSSSSCDTCSVIIKVIFYIWLRRKWQAANPATGAFISAFQLPYNLASAFAEMERKKAAMFPSIMSLISQKFDLFRNADLGAKRASFKGSADVHECLCLDTENVAERLPASSWDTCFFLAGCYRISTWNVSFNSDLSEKLKAICRW